MAQFLLVVLALLLIVLPVAVAADRAGQQTREEVRTRGRGRHRA